MYICMYIYSVGVSVMNKDTTKYIESHWFVDFELEVIACYILDDTYIYIYISI